MDHSAVIQHVKTVLTWLAGSIAAIFIGWNIGAENYWMLLLGAVVLGGISVAFFSGPFFWVLTIASSFLIGAFPILGGQITPFEVLMTLGVAKFLAEDIILRRGRFRLGNRFDLFLIAAFMGIITFHGLHDRFGMRFLGSTVWGGHNYVGVYVGLVLYFLVQSIPMPSRVWAKLPYVILAMAAFDLLIGVVTTIWPSLIFKIYPFYSAVSTAGIEEALVGESLTGRVLPFANFGLILILVILAAVSLRQILDPRNILRWIGLAAGFLAVLFAGFRAHVVSAVIGFLAAGLRDLKYGVLALLPLFAVLLFALSMINSDYFPLPKQMQRGLAFLPGKWDTEMTQDAEQSNDFRRRIWDLWMHEYFPTRPWLGRGFGFKREWAMPSAYDPKGIDYHATVEVQNIHNGLFAALDTFGIIGTIFFVIWNVRILIRVFRVPFQSADACGMAVRFLALYLAVYVISYWVGALHVGMFLPQELALAAVFFRLREATGIEADRSRTRTNRSNTDRSLGAALASA